jgi:hypothetical protein
MTTLNSPQAPSPSEADTNRGLIMDSGPRRDTLSVLGVVFAASIVVAVALPRSPPTVYFGVHPRRRPFGADALPQPFGLERAGAQPLRLPALAGGDRP